MKFTSRLSELTSTCPAVPHESQQAGAGVGGASAVAAQSSFGDIAVVTSCAAVIQQTVLLCRATDGQCVCTFRPARPHRTFMCLQADVTTSVQPPGDTHTPPTHSCEHTHSYAPTQVLPSPASTKPAAHWQRKVPGWLLQTAFDPQTRPASRHSSISADDREATRRSTGSLKGSFYTNGSELHGQNVSCDITSGSSKQRTRV